MTSLGRNHRVIAIDGTAASGKGALADRLARHFDFFRCDSGALYRSAALRLIERSQPPDEADMQALVDHVASLEPTTLADGDALRGAPVSAMASRIAGDRTLRQGISAIQRQWGRRPPGGKSGLVVDGRDATTVVFPSTPYKLFLDAGLEIRARRRYEELLQRNFSVTYEDVRRDIERRDRADRERELAPLRKAADGALIDTSHRTVDQVFDRALGLLSAKGLKRAGKHGMEGGKPRRKGDGEEKA